MLAYWRKKCNNKEKIYSALADERKFENLIFIWQATACSTRWLQSPTWIGFSLIIALKSNQRFFQHVLCFRLYMTGYPCSTRWLQSSPTWIGFWLLVGVEVQLYLFSTCLFRQSYYMPEAKASWRPVEPHIICVFFWGGLDGTKVWK